MPLSMPTPLAAPRALRPLAALRPALLATLLALAGPAFAAVTYTYTGPYFTRTYGSGAGYSTSDRVTGTLTRSQPLAPNTTYTMADFSAWSFTDGHATLNQSTGMPRGNDPASHFTLTTNASGQISSWSINLLSRSMTSVGSTGASIVIANGDSDGYILVTCIAVSAGFCSDAIADVGGYIPRPAYGTWSMSGTPDPLTPTAVPTLGAPALTLLALGLPALGAWRLRRAARPQPGPSRTET